MNSPSQESAETSSQQSQCRRDDMPVDAGSPTDTRSYMLPGPATSPAAVRDDTPGLGLSESLQSTDTVRRRPDAASFGYGSINSPASEASAANDRTALRTLSAAPPQPARSPALCPLRPRPPRSKPSLSRRTSSSQALHRGKVFSVDDDPREVEADAAAAAAAAAEQRPREQHSATRRRPGTVVPTTPLPRLPSLRGDIREDEENGDAASSGGKGGGGGGSGGGGGGGPGTEPTQPDARAGAPSGEGEEGAEGNDGNPDAGNCSAEEGDANAQFGEQQEEGEEGGGDEQLEEDEDEDEDDEDDDADASDAESFTLKDRQQAINDTHPFGIRLWKPALYKKDRSVLRTAEGDIHSIPGTRVSKILLLFNGLWILFFGWWLALLTAVGSLVCIVFAAASPSALDYGRVLWGLGIYLFYPFGMFVRLEKDDNYLHEDQGEGRSISEYEQWQQGDIEHGRLFFGPTDRSRSIVGRSRRSIDTVPSETDSLLGTSRSGAGGDDGDSVGPGGGGGYRYGLPKHRLFGRGNWTVGRVVFYVVFYCLIAPPLLLASAVCWLLVFAIPMSKVIRLLFSHLRRHPLALSFESDLKATRHAGAPSSTILLCTYRAVGSGYWKYTWHGTNVFFTNSLAVVPVVLFSRYVLLGINGVEGSPTSSMFLFGGSLVSIIPLSYFIGQAVASISAQSSMGLASALNAFFSTIIEVFIYVYALRQGKSQLVEGAIIGSIFAGALLMPGLSMCFGAIKRKTQRFNAKSAGVTSTMLLFSVICAFLPTISHQIRGTHVIRCQPCVATGPDLDLDVDARAADCRRCFYSQTPNLDDKFYLKKLRPFIYFIAFLLFLVYFIGMIFTLHTHAALIWNVEPEEKKHDEDLLASSILPSQQQQQQQLKHVVLPPRPEDLTASRQGSVAAASGNGVTPHVVPPRVPPPTVTIPGFSDAQNQAFGREVAEIATATLAARDTVRRRTSGMGHAAAARPQPPTQGRTHVEDGGFSTDAGGRAGGGHNAPNWSKNTSALVLFVCTAAYAAVSEVLVNTVDVVLEGSGIEQKFLGTTLFALVPNTTEFLNAISFAMNGNIALSMEIGSAYVLQVCLLQLPALVFYSARFGAPSMVPGGEVPNYIFTLLFPPFDAVAVIFCVFLLSYMYIEGKSNYFKGSILLLTYCVMIAGLYFSGYDDDLGTDPVVSRWDVPGRG